MREKPDENKIFVSVELYEYERLSPAPVMVVSAAAAAAYWYVVKKNFFHTGIWSGEYRG